MKNLIASVVFSISMISFNSFAEAKGGTPPETVKLFKTVCASCHGENAEGIEGFSPALKYQNFHAITRAIRDFQLGNRYPKHGTYVASLDAKGAADMATYLSGDGGSEEPLIKVSSKYNVAKFYTRKCSVCHGENAEGTYFGPRLREQNSAYFEAQIGKFTKGERPIRRMLEGMAQLEKNPAMVKELAVYLQQSNSEPAPAPTATPAPAPTATPTPAPTATPAPAPTATPAPAPTATPAPAPTATPAPVPTVTTYNANIHPLFQKYCASCHGDGSDAGNLLDYATAYSMKNAILSAVVGDHSMPMGSAGKKITEDERNLIGQWVKDGAQQ